jgi:LPXTG-motif cell wall-anchored protein
MRVAISSALVLTCWHNLRSMHGHFMHGDLAWLLIGLLVAAVAIWALSRRRRRWF